MAARLRITLPTYYLSMFTITKYINDRNEIIRLNAFAILCHSDVSDLIEANATDPFLQIKQFLYFNANTTTIFMRKGIEKYFRIFYSNMLKMIVAKQYLTVICDFTNWLHEYFLDCFAIGSCYQRKILGLNLYKALLSFTNGNLHKDCADHKKYLRNITAIDKHLKSADSWKFTNNKSLFVLLRLVLDSTLDIKQLASVLILEYFDKNILSSNEKSVSIYTGCPV